MKKALSLLLAVIMMIPLAACSSGSSGSSSNAGNSAAPSASSSAQTSADSDWAYIKKNGTLKIGITEYEPMNYHDESGKLVGFDTEFAEAACAKLGLKADFIVINWDSKEIELSSKNIDCIWNGLTVTQDRKKNMAFTDSYLNNRQVVVIRKKDSGKYKDAASLSGANVVAEKGSAGETDIKESLSGANYTAMDTQADALMEIKAGTSDAAVIDYTMAKSMTGDGTDYSDLQIADGITMQGEEYAIGFRTGSDAVAQFNSVITGFQKDGTLSNIAQKYKLTDLLIAQQ